MAQFHFGEGCKATLTFNGVIDGEPTVNSTGVGTVTQDPKVESPSPTDPSLVETKVVLHFRNASGPAGFSAISGSALADDPNTADTTETVVIDFPEVCEWINPTQAKANSVSISVEAEPV